MKQQQITAVEKVTKKVTYFWDSLEEMACIIVIVSDKKTPLFSLSY